MHKAWRLLFLSKSDLWRGFEPVLRPWTPVFFGKFCWNARQKRYSTTRSTLDEHSPPKAWLPRRTPKLQQISPR